MRLGRENRPGGWLAIFSRARKVAWPDRMLIRFPELYVTGVGRASRSVSGELRSVQDKTLRTLALTPRTSESRCPAVTQNVRQPPVPIGATLNGLPPVAAANLGLHSPLEAAREEKCRSPAQWILRSPQHRYRFYARPAPPVCSDAIFLPVGPPAVRGDAD